MNCDEKQHLAGPERSREYNYLTSASNIVLWKIIKKIGRNLTILNIRHNYKLHIEFLYHNYYFYLQKNSTNFI